MGLPLGGSTAQPVSKIKLRAAAMNLQVILKGYRIYFALQPPTLDRVTHRFIHSFCGINLFPDHRPNSRQGFQRFA